MCGLTGFLGGSVNNDMANNLIRSMTKEIIHRGPDDVGYWNDYDKKISIGHRRLSVIDISSAGHQPMVSDNGRFVIAFNGEIYNHISLRKQLDALGKVGAWKGHSDTETLLAAIEVWGLESTLRKSIGMFAIALWDRKACKLFLARDRIGEKPLYYGWQGQGEGRAFLFGSELKSMKPHPSFEPTINRDALCQLLQLNYISAPYSIYKGINKVRPGCIISVSLDSKKPIEKQYWDAISVAKHGNMGQFSGTAQQAIDQLEGLIKDAVCQQMIADVPLGAFLSGGIDSSLIVALMQAQSNLPVKTFTIGFNEKDYNEAIHAKNIAKHLGTEHTELYVTPEKAMDVIPKLPTMYCEPFADSSQIPTFLVSELARSKVTVSLSGDAGDELFCGYNRYTITNNLWKKLSYIPTPFRDSMTKVISSISPIGWDNLAKFIPGASKYTNFGDKLYKGAQVINSRTIEELYSRIISNELMPEQLVLGANESLEFISDTSIELENLKPAEYMMALDMIGYLPGDILTKVDRATMNVSLEGRVPFLDHRVIEFAWTLPLKYKLRNNQSKWILRQILSRYVPHDLSDQPKMGFALPLHLWLRGPLREWVENLIDESRLKTEGYFDSDKIRNIWAEHLSGKRNHVSLLWSVIMFQAWLDHQ